MNLKDELVQLGFVPRCTQQNRETWIQHGYRHRVVLTGHAHDAEKMRKLRRRTLPSVMMAS